MEEGVIGTIPQDYIGFYPLLYHRNRQQWCAANIEKDLSFNTSGGYLQYLREVGRIKLEQLFGNNFVHIGRFICYKVTKISLRGSYCIYINPPVLLPGVNSVLIHTHDIL